MSGPLIGLGSLQNKDAILKSLREVADSGSYTESRFVQSLEDEVSKIYGMYCVALNNAGSGLFILANWLRAQQLGGGTVLVPNNTFFATGAMFMEADQKIALVDCGVDDFSMTETSLVQAVSHVSKKAPDRPIAVVLTHVGGPLAKDYQKISRWCLENKVFFFEDAAHALGSSRSYDGVVYRAGKLSDAAVFSLYPTKAVPAGEGGLLVTPHIAIAEYARIFRNYGKSIVGGTIRYGRGFNLRMDEWTAAVAMHQVKRLSEIIEKRNLDAEKLGRVVPSFLENCGTNNWYKYPVESTYPAKRTTGKVYALSDQLNEALKMCLPYDRLKNSIAIAERHICLPIGEDVFTGKSAGEVERWLTSR